MAEQILGEIDELISRPTNRHLEDCGKPVIGYLCHYVPVEIILAAGGLPLRLRGAGSEDSSTGDAYLSGRTCTYVRHVMGLVLDGEYDLLDGVVNTNSCDHVRRATDLFAKKTDVRFQGFVSIPRSLRESLFPFYLDELRRLHEGLAAELGAEATDAALREAIATINGNRRRLAAINELRTLEQPKLTGAEALAVHIAAQVLPPAVFADLADRLLATLKERPGRDSSRGRLVLIGAELDEPAYVEAVESQQALVVADLLCFGARSVLDPIDEEAPDPLEAIGRAYFFRPSCARMIGDFDNRFQAIQDLVERTRADGVVFERLLFCDPWGADQHNLITRSQDGAAFPFLALSREYGIVPTGQIRTRVQAFVEKIEISRAQRQGGAR